MRCVNTQDDIASALERGAALASWADPFATALALLFCLCAAVLIGALGLSPVLAFAMCWLVRVTARGLSICSRLLCLSS